MAKKFQFRLERVRELKRSIKADKYRELALATKLLNEAEAELRSLYQAWGEGGGAAEVTSVELLVLDQQYRLRLQAAVAQKQLDVFQRNEAVEAARASYLEAHRDSEIYERLKDKARQTYQEYVDFEEAKVLDEVAVQRSGRAKLVSERKQAEEYGAKYDTGK